MLHVYVSLPCVPVLASFPGFPAFFGVTLTLRHAEKAGS